MRSKYLFLVGLAFAASGAAGAASAYQVQFNAGTYDLAEQCDNSPAPCGSPSDGSFTITLTPGAGNSPATASFVVSLDTTGPNNLTETASFVLPEIVTPSGFQPDTPGDFSPFFSASSLISESWSASDHPYVAFYAPTGEDGGGMTIADGTVTSGVFIAGNPLIETFAAGDTGSPYSVIGTPEPPTWATLIVGVGLAGAAVRRRVSSPPRPVRPAR
jgi:hypothetical protein